MKSIKLLLLAGALFLGFNAGSAQSKIAHINAQELVASMPEMKQMQEELKKIAQTYDTEYKSQQSALQAKLQKYDAEAATQTDAENQKRAKEVQDLTKKIQLYGQEAQQQLAKREQDLYKPISDKARKAIADVAKEKGIQYVMDSSPGRSLIVHDGEDLMAAVKAKLGIK